MGVPAFFRWLSDRFPKTLVDIVEEEGQIVDDVEVPVDTSKPNPNGQEFDNFYLDMNNIIHPCFHPENKPAPTSEDEIMIEIMKYIDRLFNMVRPRKILFMAIDGVAPRAKMNQQRTRRFRSAKDAAEEREAKAKVLAEQGKEDEEVEKKHMDSNCITPGTPFMARVADALRYYIHERLQTDPGWKNIKVILSDSNVPGEGEHKVMEFVRAQRSQPDYDANTRHVIYGLDADLIMLGLATHEAHFFILRDIITMRGPNKCNICQREGHFARDCRATKEELDELADMRGTKKNLFQMLSISVLREYLEIAMKVPDLPFDFDLDRAVDDFVFLCFLVGNDFLPHLPTLEIRENAIDTLVNLYKKVLPVTGWLSEHGEVNRDGFQKFLQELSPLEDGILAKRREGEMRRKQQAKDRQREQDRRAQERKRSTPDDENNTQKNAQAAASLRSSMTSSTEEFSTPEPPRKRQHLENFESPTTPPDDSAPGTPSTPRTPGTPYSNRSTPAQSPAQSPAPGRKNEQDDDEPEDEVRLGEVGWKDRYYASKFKADMNNKPFLMTLGEEYVRGLIWVLRYYYSGCCSWGWYYPYYYAPFSGEMALVDSSVEFKFEKGVPFQPVQQLMSVLPPASAPHVPVTYRKLMLDEKSPLSDFYPIDFKIDMNGKKQKWLGVALLPFIDEQRLLKALKPLEKTLTEEEQYQNREDFSILHVPSTNSLSPVMEEIYSNKTSGWSQIDREFSGDLTGFIGPYERRIKLGKVFKSDIAGLEDIAKCMISSTKYKYPDYPPTGIARGILPTATLPEPVLTEEDRNPKPRYQRGQNHAANRMVNHYTGSNQYKDNQNNFNRHDYNQSGHKRPREEDDSRDNRGGYDNRNNRGGYGGNRGGYNNRDNRGGYGDNRGYNDRSNSRDNYRGGYDNRDNRGGYDNRDNRSNDRGGYGNRGSNDSRDYRDNRGGYDNRSNNRGGYQQGGRGGYQQGGSHHQQTYQQVHQGGYQQQQPSYPQQSGYPQQGYQQPQQQGGFYQQPLQGLVSQPVVLGGAPQQQPQVQMPNLPFAAFGAQQYQQQGRPGWRYN
eukprot:TRINITY_DN4472_c0_g1_i4.p1 TRINITY_DN4472_c0_g1~~TRINITY_DN4472_c0_g1_i4.p1  ORF type:complete len:1063 (+),score=296.53 TRINITY_DN4472_c0_g1_i4:70-3258(+)